MKRASIVIVALVAFACGHPPRKPPRSDVSARKDHAGHVAVGHATLVGAAAKAGGASPHMRLATARAWLGLAEELEALGQYAEAYTAALGGIAELGDLYRTPPLKDDSHMALKYAEGQAAAGQHDDAADEAIGALRSRVQRYVRKHQGEVE